MRRKISVLLLAAGMVLAAAMPSQAIDFKVKGQWQVGFQHSNVFPAYDKTHASGGVNTKDKFSAQQRIRLHLDAVASENLSGSVEFEIGAQEWGKASDGAALGADGKVVKVRFAYLDWIIPNTQIKTRMGLQMIMMPGIMDKYGCSPVFGKEMAGITVSSPILDGDVKMDAALFWARPYNDNANPKTVGNRDRNGYLDNLDVFGLSLPVRGDGWKVTPWAMYAMMGKYSLTGLNRQSLAANGFDSGILAPQGGLLPVLGGNVAWDGYINNNVQGLRHNRAYNDGVWFGLPVSVNITDALRIGAEGVYGYVNMGSIRNYGGFKDGRTNKSLQLKREGWYVGLRADYKFDWGTPGILAWYGSGDDSNPYNGSERLPQFNTPWATTSLGGGDVLFDDHQSWKVLGHNPGGSAAIVAQIDKMSFVEDLSHTLRFAYFHGTNSPKMPRKAAFKWAMPSENGPMGYLTTLDHAYEVNLQNVYKIYENLTVGVEGAYVRLNLDDSVWKYHGKGIGKDNYRVNCVFTYNF